MATGAFTAAEMKAMRPEIEAALKDLGDRLGISFKVGGGSYGQQTAQFKLELGRIGDDGQAVTKFREAWDQLAPIYGLEPEWFGRTFRSGGTEYRIAGLAPRRRKPVLVDRTRDGRQFLFGEDTVRALILAA